MLDRILGKPVSTGADSEDCLSCRLIGGGGMACLGSYILYKSYAGRQSMTKWSLMGSACLGSIILSIASIRLLDVNIKNIKPKEDNNRN